jgi:hypothetical protein
MGKQRCLPHLNVDNVLPDKLFLTHDTPHFTIDHILFADMMAQALELSRRPHIVVATPGRLVDLIRSSSDAVNFKRLKFLVRRNHVYKGSFGKMPNY